jgi:hypothetical protein
MSHPLVSHSDDLQRLYKDGYTLEIRDACLLVKNVPFVTSTKEVAYGTLVSELTTTGTRTSTPGSHQIRFAGGIPCDDQGAALDSQLISGKNRVDLGGGLVIDCEFSYKPERGYRDYHAKMSTYANYLVDWARKIDPTATATSYPPIQPAEEESVFRYLDAASSRAQISHLSSKLKPLKIGIVGIGGTGVYILDLVTKTPVAEIHTFDDDEFYAHNAFRAPGAAAAPELDERPLKVDYFQHKYDSMHRHVKAHPYPITEDNVHELTAMSFVFISMDTSPIKRLIFETLEKADLPFIDVGMGVDETQSGLAGLLRVTASFPGSRAHVWEDNSIDFAAPAEDAYDRNIQTAELNALNATLAVIKWKKYYGFYADYEGEHTTLYTLARNKITNEDRTS